MKVEPHLRATGACDAPALIERELHAADGDALPGPRDEATRGDALAVDEGAVGRAEVGDEQRAIGLALKARMTLRDGRMRKDKLVLGRATDVDQRLVERGQRTRHSIGECTRA